MRLSRILNFITLFLAACGENESGPTAMPTILPTPVPTAEENLPEITAVTLDRIELPRYESLEMTVELEAEYNNPYDAREVTLDGTFIAPNGGQMLIPGFWDGEEAWRVRFTPSEEGEWGYSLTITPYDTWQGTFLDAFDVTCTAGSACTIPLPQFQADMAFKIERS